MASGVGDDYVPSTDGTAEDDRSARARSHFAGQEAWHWDLNRTLLLEGEEGQGCPLILKDVALTSPAHLAPKPPLPG